MDHGRIQVSDLVLDLAQRVADRLVGQIDEVTRTGQVHRAEDLLAQLEAAIAGYALLLPVMLAHWDGLLGHAAAVTDIWQWYLLQCAAALLLLFLPAWGPDSR